MTQVKLTSQLRNCKVHTYRKPIVKAYEGHLKKMVEYLNINFIFKKCTSCLRPVTLIGAAFTSVSKSFLASAHGPEICKIYTVSQQK
ncbi:hypothetical protein T05_11203 [Trichinella murrelli]|uniref:Uncharacterized protein n=1 Tax=Trichinella murrelli TaxID=144512 RepID=A0A0V0TGE2_9BILA|nr:hypothetical protein T05_11203 [Trichinella murrelli]